MSTREQRGYQMFPVLDGARVETALRFASGPERHFVLGEMLYDHGQQGAPAWLVLLGSVDITRRDGLDREAPVVTFGPGQFTSEVNQFAARPAITRARAGDARPFDAAHLRALMIGSAEIGETLMRALILRRVELIEEGAAGTIIIGARDSSAVVRLQNFLARSGYPYQVIDARGDG
ncbi:MAG: hypothetical protein BroJett011_17270 [Chloroflexota bacterium]|nr:MAG: hypothetical protein BroJett011_17270 [Chloroflexota bacterium]